MSATAPAITTPRARPVYLLKLINGPRRPKATRIVPVRLDEQTSTALVAFAAGADAASPSARKVTTQTVITAALDSFLASARPANFIAGDLHNGDEIQAIAAE